MKRTEIEANNIVLNSLKQIIDRLNHLSIIYQNIQKGPNITESLIAVDTIYYSNGVINDFGYSDIITIDSIKIPAEFVTKYQRLTFVKNVMIILSNKLYDSCNLFFDIKKAVDTDVECYTPLKSSEFFNID